VVNLADDDEDDDSSSSDDDLKKNIYNEIPEYDDVDEVKLAVQALDMDAVLRQQNVANENLYSEIHLNEERFENALYMAHEKQQQQQEAKQKSSSVAVGAFPSPTSKTRSFYPVGAPLPSIPPSSAKMIPEEGEPSWCCGTRRRRRRSLVLGLFLTSFFLLFLCVALLVRMYVPPADDDRRRGLWVGDASAVKSGDGAEWLYGGENRVVEAAAERPLVLDDAIFEPETASSSSPDFEIYDAELTSKGVRSSTTTTTTTTTTPSSAGVAFGVSTAEFLQNEAASSAAGDDDHWETGNRVVTTEETEKKPTSHMESICTSWQGKRRLTMSCPTPDATMEVVDAYYGWSKSEAVCHAVEGDAYCRINEGDVARRCDGLNSCQFWADASGWLLGCSGYHDFLQVHYICVRS